MGIFNFFKNFALAKRIINFIAEVKKHFETSTVDDRVKALIGRIIDDIKEFGTLIPELKPEVIFIIDGIKKILGIKEDKK